MALTQVEIPFVENLDFGVGVDSMTSSPMGKVVVGQVTGVTGADGSKVGFQISRIQTTHELETKLGIDVKASYAASAFANISGRFDFSRDSKIQSSSLFMAITSNITLATHSINDPALSPAATSLADNPSIFASRFGDMFVRGIGRGGLFVAVLQIETTDEKTSEDISSELSGVYGLFSGDAKQKFESIQHDFHSDLSIRVYHEGGPVDLSMDSIDNPVQLYTMLQTWLKSFVDHPDTMAVPYFASLAPVVIANGPLPLNAADAEHAQDVLVNCAKQRSATLDAMNLMDAIIHAPQRYSFTPPITMADIQKASNGFQNDLDVIAAAASAAMNHPASAKLPAAFAAASNQVFPQGLPPTPMPELNKALVNVLARKGQLVIADDPLLNAMRKLEPEGPGQLGFEIGVAVASADTLWGPGKQSTIDNLPVEQQKSADNSAHFVVERNANVDFATKGAAVAKADTRPDAIAARAAQTPGYYTLGFDIGAGLFANSTLGGANHTLPGPGSNAIRNSLHPDGKQGYDVSAKLYMGK